MLRVACVVVATLFVWPVGTAQAAISVGATGTGTGTPVGLVTTATPSWSASTTANSLLVAILTYNTTTPTILATGWTLAASSANGSAVTTAIYYIQNAGSQSSATFTATGLTSAPALTVQLLELKGMLTSGALDVTATNTTSSLANSLTVTPGSTTVGANEVAIVAFAHDNSGNAFQWGNAPAGMTALSELSNTTRSISAYDTTISAGTQLTETMAIKTSNKTANIAGAVASFKANVTTKYWRGGASDCATGSNWTTTTCWATSSGGASSGLTPGATDAVVFESAKVGGCTINSAITAGSITVNTGYTGTITHSSGNISLAGSIVFQSGTTATFNSTSTSSSSILTNQSGTYDGDIVLAGGTFTVSASPIGLRGLAVSGGNFTSGSSAVTTNNAGTVTLSSGTATFGSGGLTPTSTVTVSGATVAMGNHAFTAGSAVTCSDGSMTFGSGNVAFNGGLIVSGAGSVSLPTAGTQTATTVTVSSTSASALTFSSGTTFSTTGNFAQSAGTVTGNSATLHLGTGIGSTDALTMTGGTFNAGTSTIYSGGSAGSGSACNNGGPTTTINGSSATFNGASGVQHFCGPLNVTSGTLNTGTANMATNSNGSGFNSETIVTVSSGGTMTIGSGGFDFPSSTAMTIAGTLNGGGTVSFAPAVTISSTGTYSGGSSATTFSGTLTVNGACSAGSGSLTVSGAGTIGSTGTYNANTSTTTFSNTLALSGTFNANSSTSVTFSGAVTMSGSSAFNGNTGSGTFSVAPTLTAGTFTVGDSGTTGKWTFTLGATFTSGMTLAFPASGGELATASGQTLSVAGPVNAATTGTKPKIDCPACTTNQGFTMTFTATATLNIDGLQFDHVSTAGVQIANGATYTKLKNLKFTNNAAGGTSSGTHLAITKASSVITVPGCFFDATAAVNVTLVGTSASPGVRAIFEFQSTTVNGARAGEAFDSDADTTGDNVADGSAASSPFASVVEWVGAMPTDTTGTAVGFPLAAFDWNTFTFYGIYVAYKDTAGAGSADIVWLRNNDGSPAYSFSVPQTSGDIVGTPFFDTINETTAGVDANGDGDQLDTDVRIAYVGTTTGHIIKLVDNGSGLVQPTSGPWSTDFTSATVATITSPLIEDGVNLYFGGTDGSAATKVFGVQVAGGANEKTLQKNVGSVSAVTTTPAWTTYSGITYVFLGSTATSNQAFVYRINMSAGVVDASFNGPTSNVNDSVVLSKNRAYAVTDGGKLYVLDASNFGVGGFTNLTGSPYVATAAKAIKSAPWVDYTTSNAYFGDDGGNLYAVTSAGANLNSGYPFVVSASIKLSSSPMYRKSGGVIAVGANDGYIYFIDRNSGSNTPSIFKRFFVTSAGTVSSVSYDSNISEYLVSSSDGKLAFINAADVTDPTPATE